MPNLEDLLVGETFLEETKIAFRLKSFSYDNALAETVIGLYKVEVIKRLRPWERLVR